MSYQFDHAPSERILRGAIVGRVNDELMSEFYEKASDLARRYLPHAGIADFSGVTSFDVSAHLMATLATMEPIVPTGPVPRFIVAPATDVYGMWRMFQIMGEETRGTLRIVRTLDEVGAALGLKGEFRFEPLGANDLGAS